MLGTASSLITISDGVPSPSCNIRCRQVRLNHTPFLIGHVGLVSVRLANMLFSGGWGPHGNSGVGVRTLWNHVDPNHSTLFETASKPELNIGGNHGSWNSALDVRRADSDHHSSRSLPASLAERTSSR